MRVERLFVRVSSLGKVASESVIRVFVFGCRGLSALGQVPPAPKEDTTLVCHLLTLAIEGSKIQKIKKKSKFSKKKFEKNSKFLNRFKIFQKNSKFKKKFKIFKKIQNFQKDSKFSKKFKIFKKIQNVQKIQNLRVPRPQTSSLSCGVCRPRVS